MSCHTGADADDYPYSTFLWGLARRKSIFAKGPQLATLSLDLLRNGRMCTA